MDPFSQIASLTEEIKRAPVHAEADTKMSLWSALWHPRNADTRKKFYTLALVTGLGPFIVMALAWAILASYGVTDPSTIAGVCAVISVVLILAGASIYVLYDDDTDSAYDAANATHTRRAAEAEADADAAGDVPLATDTTTAKRRKQQSAAAAGAGAQPKSKSKRK